MRCEDCIPLIEEYFDGEVDLAVGEQMSAHLSACADCAAALDALSFEQEIYTRYERDLEVKPALWAAVSARVAREPLREKHARRWPFLVGLREGLAAALGVFTLRPALASTLALLFVGVAAGALWLAYVRRTETSTVAVVNTPTAHVAASPAPTAIVGENIPPPSEVANVNPEIEKVSQPRATGEPGARPEPKATRPATPEEMIAWMPAAHPDNSGLVSNNPPQHEREDEVARLVETPKADTGIVTASAQSLDAGEKEIARHVEQAQMLLRSIKNARPSDGENMVNVAYEKKLSRKLLADNATLQLEAEVNGDKDTKQVLDQIEPFLLDIANMRDKPSREEVRSLKERVKKDEIIAALQVY